MEPFTTLTSRVVCLPVDNIDTDQIIPARYLKCTEKAGIGAGLFADWRYSPDGSPRPDFAMNAPAVQGAQILLAGENFGCGSSREHAPWALTGSGFRAVIAGSFADIFRNNSGKNGLLTIQLGAAARQQMVKLLQENPSAAVTIDLPAQTVHLPDGAVFSFAIDPFLKTCLLRGTDELGYLMGYQDQIQQYEAGLPDYRK